MPNITGKVVDFNNSPVSSAILVLREEEVSSQIQQSDTEGKFVFVNVKPSIYKLSVLIPKNNYVSEQTIQMLTDQTTDTHADFLVDMSLVPKTGSSVGFFANDKYVYLKYIQYIFLAGTGWFFFYKLIGDKLSFELLLLKDMSIARGVITYLVAVTTIAMAALLMLASILTGGKDLDKRFALGKEILTLLIGILGTIIGFYYGSSTKDNATAAIPASDSVRVQNIKVIPESPRAGTRFNLKMQVTGGKKPYLYSIDFKPAKSINGEITDKQSESGIIEETFMLDTNVKNLTQVGFIIQGTDSENKPFRYPSSGEQKITLKK
ncbi:carboxypeptidase-like regulatory domain-containing protein [Xanthocytophaga agilis]|uniref:Carboxypeptidase-like regulatory domain-containing protein n=1 Tax=Xanthocytophaga agilis TaxID=3048010 RepID=A0AAE3UHK9_9BACT|nr:carboxypeptidase-like regulatory domain-containing protein [Xanthocytophaga agilis]MDJ1503597.1 carboxypeptidase-like regulatory domain-containing protein [Xanthocytophaga agilis]